MHRGYCAALGTTLQIWPVPRQTFLLTISALERKIERSIRTKISSHQLWLQPGNWGKFFEVECSLMAQSFFSWYQLDVLVELCVHLCHMYISCLNVLVWIWINNLYDMIWCPIFAVAVCFRIQGTMQWGQLWWWSWMMMKLPQVWNSQQESWLLMRKVPINQQLMAWLVFRYLRFIPWLFLHSNNIIWWNLYYLSSTMCIAYVLVKSVHSLHNLQSIWTMYLKFKFC